MSRKRKTMNENCNFARTAELHMNETAILHRLQKCSRHLKSFQKKLASYVAAVLMHGPN